MKKVILLCFLCILLFSCLYAHSKPTAILFYSPRCKSCLDVKKEFLGVMKEKYKDKLEWREIDTTASPENLSLLLSLNKRLRGDKKALIPSVAIGNFLLVGKKQIQGELETAITVSLDTEAHPFSFLKVDIIDVFAKISVLTVMGSGLIDGVNPCAFAVIVFFVSFLAVYGYRKREIIYVGSSYCTAVFLTYFLIGLGLFNFLYSLSHIYIFIKLFYYFVALFCFILCGLALYDYFKFKKTGESEELMLQLPKFLKKRINIVIGSQLRQKQERGAPDLIISSFIVGFFVSLLEGVCTGQVYLPTIVFILKNTSLKLKAFFYLLLYNLMFILPLVIIFILSLVGLRSQAFNNFLKRRLGAIKILMALLFLGLGLLILFYDKIEFVIILLFQKLYNFFSAFVVL
ncbi:MAG: hypothetical protein JSW40_02515 [Candidatus Omnitrophota bacterium]|nr:MAG: hypothetical protein JSW40_02515 [Candidatus Omnitrophota bacterium]